MPMSNFSKFLVALKTFVRKNPPPFPLVFKFKNMDKVGVLDAEKFWVIQVDVSSWNQTSWLPVLLKVFAIFQDGFPEGGMDQVGDDLPWDWEPDALERTCWQDQDFLDFVEEPSLVLLWASLEQEGRGKALRAPWWWTHGTSDETNRHNLGLYPKVRNSSTKAF
jgi:hypothetical protein